MTIGRVSGAPPTSCLHFLSPVVDEDRIRPDEGDGPGTGELAPAILDGIEELLGHR
jgi:hypothetical protein